LRARKTIFGSSSEKTSAIDNQLSLLIPLTDDALAQELLKHQKEVSVPKHKRTARKPGVRAERLKDLPMEVVECEIDENEKCFVCDSKLVKIGKKVVRSEVVYIPASIKVLQYVQVVYKCVDCGEVGSDNDKNVIVKATVPRSLLAHSIASPSVVAQVMYQKYVMGMPLNRIEKDWSRLDFILSKTTMANWVIRCSEEWLKPIYDRIHEQLLKSHVLHCDETTIQCNKEKGKKASSKSYMWVLCSGVSEEHQATLFYYSRSRGSEHAKYLLNGYGNYLVTDAYSGYDPITMPKRALCWAHVRRYYKESIPLDHNGKEFSGSKGAEGREFCNQLFKIEREIASLSTEEKLIKRQELSKPVLEVFWLWVEKTSQLTTTNEKLTKALNYSKNQKKYLETFLEDADIPISNNACENKIRPFATGRRAWLFADSPKGATASAIVYSIVESAKSNNLQPYEYLKYLFESIPQMDFYNKPDLLDKCLPWSSLLPDRCKIKSSQK